MTCSGPADDGVSPIPNSVLEWATMEELITELKSRVIGMTLVIARRNGKTGDENEVRFFTKGATPMSVGLAQMYISTLPSRLEETD